MTAVEEWVPLGTCPACGASTDLDCHDRCFAALADLSVEDELTQEAGL